MKLTRFRRLRNAIASIDLQFVKRSVEELRSRLGEQGLEYLPKNTVITQEGIYYINPETGMAVKVALYQSEQWLKSENVEMRAIDEKGYTEPEALEIFNKYHLVRCNLLTHYELHGWGDHYRISHRDDDSFFFRLRANMANRWGRREDFHQDIAAQSLYICPNCLIKINSMLSTEKDIFSEETFRPGLFFAAGFQATWRDRTKPSTSERGLDEIHPKDLEELCRKRKEQAEYICESCDIDMSIPDLRKFACIQYQDHLSNGVSFIRFRCLCVKCAVDEPAGRVLGDIGSYDQYMQLLEKYGNG